jgi:hypothetical protein
LRNRLAMLRTDAGLPSPLLAKRAAAQNTYRMDENHTAVESSSSRHPQHRGRAMSVVLTRLAETMAREGDRTTDEVLLNRDIRLHIATEDEQGARITATCLGTDATAEEAVIPRI